MGKEKICRYEYPRVVEFIKELPKALQVRFYGVLQAKEFVGKRS